jgi:putative hydrolase of the HAD superfamily
MAAEVRGGDHPGLKNGIECVLFDAVGTLIYPDPCVAEAYRIVGGSFGCSGTIEDIHRKFQQAFAAEEACDAATGRTSEERERSRWRNIVQQVFPEAPDLDGLFEALWLHFADPANWSVFPDAQTSWHRLTAEHRLAIASNFDSRLKGICQAHSLFNGLKDVFVSSELGWRKPGPGFFREIESRLGIPGDQLLVVGDDLKNDYQAAVDAGWQAILINRKPSANPSLLQIASLAELPDLLAAVA